MAHNDSERRNSLLKSLNKVESFQSGIELSTIAIGLIRVTLRFSSHRAGYKAI